MNPLGIGALFLGMFITTSSTYRRVISFKSDFFQGHIILFFINKLGNVLSYLVDFLMSVWGQLCWGGTRSVEIRLAWSLHDPPPLACANILSGWSYFVADNLSWTNGKIMYFIPLLATISLLIFAYWGFFMQLDHKTEEKIDQWIENYPLRRGTSFTSHKWKIIRWYKWQDILGIYRSLRGHNIFKAYITIIM